MRRLEKASLAKTPPTHPGHMLRDHVLPGLGLSTSQAARELGVARSTLHRLFTGEAGFTPEMAARLARLSGVPSGFWLARQQVYDLWRAERTLANALRQIPARTLPRLVQEKIGVGLHD